MGIIWVSGWKGPDTNTHVVYLKQIQGTNCYLTFLSDPGVPGVRSMGPDLSNSLSPRLCADLTDVTLADEDSNSIPTDDVNEQSQAM